MKRLIRGMAGLAVILGASACAEDYSLDFGGEPTQLQATPYSMNVVEGETEEVLVRLINDRNQAIPADVVISNVGAGISVEVDRTYRPDYVGSDTLEADPLQVQHRVLVTAEEAVRTTFTITSGSFSTDVTVQVLPTVTGALSTGAPAFGQLVTITAPTNLSFTTEGEDVSTVTFTPGGAALITERTATSISFYAYPGSMGPATVSNVKMNYAPTLPAMSVVSTNDITAPFLPPVPITFSSTTPLVPVTATVSGWSLADDVEIQVDYRDVWVESVAPDGKSAVIILPNELEGGDVVIENITNDALPIMSLPGQMGSSSATTGAGPVGANPDGAAPALVVAEPGTQADLYVTLDADKYWGADILGGDGPNTWIKLVVPSAGARVVTVDWNSTADFDFVVLADDLDTVLLSRGSAAHPELGSADFPAAGTYWIGIINWHAGAQPSIAKISVK